MKLHDALRKVIRQSGVSIIQEKRLLFSLLTIRPLMTTLR